MAVVGHKLVIHFKLLSLILVSRTLDLLTVIDILCLKECLVALAVRLVLTFPLKVVPDLLVIANWLLPLVVLKGSLRLSKVPSVVGSWHLLLRSHLVAIILMIRAQEYHINILHEFLVVFLIVLRILSTHQISYLLLVFETVFH